MAVNVLCIQMPSPTGTWHKLRIKQLGANIEVWVDDIHKTSFDDIPGSTNWNTAESALLSGRWVYYHEDARVEFDDAPRIPSGSLPPPNDDPVNLTITTSVSYIILSWTAPISPYGQVQGYNIYVNGVKNNGAPEPNRGYTLTRLAASTMYQIKITTVVDGKESLGVLRSVTTNAGSTAPLITVSTVSQLHDALAGTSAGQTIQISDGNYNGNFVLRNKHGTLEQPIIIQGTKNAIIHGGVTTGGYALYLDNCTYVQLKGFQITGAQKSLMCEQVCNSTIDSLTTHDCGAESIALRNLSSDNIVKNCEVYNTGLVSPQYGEGIYIGMYYGDWSSSKSRTGGMPDASDRNQILSNNIHDTGAECIDIKEGTSNGVIRGNTLEGKYMSGQNYADSWIDIAGCGYTVENNTGTDALLDGIQTHTQPGGIKTASDNIFRSNVLNVNVTGYGISIDTAGSGNVVYASNSVTGSAKGLTNITITP